MLQFWERSNGQIADAVIPVSADKKRELSERQKVILDLIEHGKTNNIIARELGFSESLIRQETISIYKKLGIQGRKNLTIKSADPHSSAH
jgi:DNA-binding NarL/FixJ family response regulator